MNMQQSKPKSFFLTQIQTVFLATMIASDFAFGMVVKNLLAPTHILDIIRIDMIVPFMLMLLTRLIVDKFGVLILYEAIWGVLAVIAMPASFGLPGLLKLVPAISMGIILDSLMSVLKNYPKTRVYVSAVIGGFLSTLVFFGFKIMLGMPWNTFIQILFGVQMLTNGVVWFAGAFLTLLVFQRIRDTQMVRRIQVALGH
jgi:hypothetical protein